MTEFEPLLLSVDAGAGMLELISAEGARLGRFPREPSPPHATAIARGADGTIFVAAERPAEIVAYTPSGARLRAFGRGTLARPVSIAVDRRGQAYVLDAERECVAKFDRDGAHVASADAPSPLAIFLSRASSSERYIAVTSTATARIVVLATANLEQVSLQDLSASFSGLLNSERVAPELVYMAGAGAIHAFRDKGGRFNFEQRFAAGEDPVALAETHDAIYACCARTGTIWRQRTQGQDFTLFAETGLNRPTALLALATPAADASTRPTGPMAPERAHSTS